LVFPLLFSTDQKSLFLIKTVVPQKIYYKIKTMGLPFGISRWHVRHDTLRHLKQKIAPSTIRVMEGVLNLKLFNVFSAIGPVDCFDSYDSESSPIILGSIWLMPYGNGKPNSSGSSRGFVLGV